MLRKTEQLRRCQCVKSRGRRITISQFLNFQLFCAIAHVRSLHEAPPEPADSFNGVPPPNPELYPHDGGDRHSTMVELAIPQEEVEENFKKHHLLDNQIVFLKGWFKDTLPTAPIDKIAVLRLDGDLYESYMDGLNSLYHKISKGGFVIIDDYGMGPVKEAIKDFRIKHNIVTPIIDIDESGVYWRIE